MSALWSCEFKLAECRNPFGCHCREIIALHHQVKTLEKAHAAPAPGVREKAIRECAKVVEKYGLERMDDVKDYPATIAAACLYRIRALIEQPGEKA